MKWVKNTLAFIGLASLMMIFAYAMQDAPTDENFEKKLINDSHAYAVQILDHLNLAGEEVAVDDRVVYERMGRELLVNAVWQSTALLAFKRAHNCLPV